MEMEMSVEGNHGQSIGDMCLFVFFPRAISQEEGEDCKGYNFYDYST